MGGDYIPSKSRVLQMHLLINVAYNSTWPVRFWSSEFNHVLTNLSSGVSLNNSRDDFNDGYQVLHGCLEPLRRSC